jgi:hypothetical protein
MKRKLGIVGTLICSAGLVALPTLAQQRGAYGNYGAQQNGSAANRQSYDQRQPGATKTAQTYAENTRSDHAQYAANAERYSAHPVTTFERGRDERDNHDRDRRSNRVRHDRDDFRRDHWDWR